MKYLPLVNTLLIMLLSVGFLSGVVAPTIVDNGSETETTQTDEKASPAVDTKPKPKPKPKTERTPQLQLAAKNSIVKLAADIADVLDKEANEAENARDLTGAIVEKGLPLCGGLLKGMDGVLQKQAGTDLDKAKTIMHDFAKGLRALQ